MIGHNAHFTYMRGKMMLSDVCINHKKKKVMIYYKLHFKSNIKSTTDFRFLTFFGTLTGTTIIFFHILILLLFCIIPPISVYYHFLHITAVATTQMFAHSTTLYILVLLLLVYLKDYLVVNL